MTRSRVVVVVILAAASLGGWRLGQAHRAATAEWTVVNVVDGDTIDVARGPRPRHRHGPPVGHRHIRPV